MMRVLIILWLLIGEIGHLYAQAPNLGMPFIHSYPKEVYRSGAQSWEVAQNAKGVIYFANNNGLLYYDGSLWKTYPLPNSTIVRSVAISDLGDVYVGGQNEFGKFSPNEQGVLTFQSLKSLIPEAYREFEDVWDIIVNDQKVFFRANGKVFIIEDNQCTVYDDWNIEFLGQANGKVFAQDLSLGLLYYENGKFNHLKGSAILKNKLISEILPESQYSIVTTQNNGLFVIGKGGIQEWKIDASDFLKQNHITSAAIAENGDLALGTDFAGVLIINSYGKSRFHLDRSNSLINNKVFSVYFDKSQNLWLGVDNGINFIELNSPFTRIYPDGELEGAGFDVKVFQNRVYFSTSNGLYTAEWKRHYDPLTPVDFELVKNTKGQNWGLDIIGNELLLGHNNGAYSIRDRTATLIYGRTGVWNFEVLKGRPDYAIAGTYKSFSIFKKQNENWTHLNDIENWSESCRFLEQDVQGNIWMSHPYKGIYKTRLDESLTNLQVKKYGVESGLPSTIKNHLFKIKDEIIFCGEYGSFLYDYEKDIFEPYARFNEVFGEKNKIRRFFESSNDDLWFITDHIGILKIENRGLDKKIDKKIFPQFKNQLNPGFESVYSFDDKNVFFTNDKGFIHYNPSFNFQVDSIFEVVINKVSLTSKKDSLIFGGYKSNQFQSQSFNADENAFQFSYSATDYIGKEYIQYRYFLEGFERKWSEWSSINIKEYTNLSPGNYRFSVQAKNQYGSLSSISDYSFRILAPWYASSLAYLLYGLLTMGLLGAIIRAYQKKYYGLKEDRDQTIKASEEAIGKLKEEKVKAELEYKQRELASTAMHVVQKNETLGKIKGELLTLKKMNKDSLLSKEIQKMINMLNQDEIIDDGWEQFMFHFNQLHGDFYNRLNAQYPELTPKDLKMCTYLRMNLSTKEMASLLNVTIRGIEASRYRLRKKIRLDKEDNLTEFLMKF